MGSDSNEARDRLMMKHTVATVELILELIMNFAKTVPEFRDLLPEDKVILLQVRTQEVKKWAVSQLYDTFEGTKSYLQKSPGTAK